MSDNVELKALERLSAAIARLEAKLNDSVEKPSADNEIVHKHATLKADVSAIIRDLDNLIEGARNA